MRDTQPSGIFERHLMPDLVRAIALIGIALVNVSIIAYPLAGGYINGGFHSTPDSLTFFLVMGLCTMKFYPLFSFMFGVGFAYQMKLADRAGVSFGRQYFRRILGLAGFGFLNIALLFQGDVLVMYAMLGSLLFLFRNASSRTLIKWGIGFYTLQIFVFLIFTTGIYLGEKLAPDDMNAELAIMSETVMRSHTIYASENFTDSVILRLQEWSEIIQIGIFMDGLGAMAFFLFGLAAVKLNIIANPQALIWRRFRLICLPIGLIGSFAGAYIQSLDDSLLSSVNMLGMTMIAVFALFSSAGYLGLIAKWSCGPTTNFKAFMARGGSATLTAYLLQGFFLSFIFNGYGLGYYAKLGAFECTLIALLISLLTLSLVSLWRKYYERGPFERILHRITYLQAH